ncbi:hypothetical protein BLOT_009076 [Blomia tropicalis]|nr:hypothetical protein BLOT_009076 [Blomia tropicalis]
MDKTIEIKSKRKALRSKITKAANGSITTSVEEIEKWQSEYEDIIDKHYELVPESAEKDKEKDEAYRVRLESLFEIESSRRTLSSVHIADDSSDDEEDDDSEPDLDQFFRNLPAGPSSSKGPRIEDLGNSQPQTSQPTTQPNPHQSSSHSGSNNASNRMSNANDVQQVPNIRASDLPTFDGNILNWMSFKRVFESTVINNNSLCDARKLGLLLKVVSDSASDRVNDLVRRGKSVRSIWLNLNSRYSDPKKIDEEISELVRSLPFVSSEFDSNILRDMKRQMGRLSSTCKSFGFAYAARAESWVSEILKKFSRPLQLQLARKAESLSQLEAEIERMYKAALRLEALSPRPSYSSAPRSSNNVASRSPPPFRQPSHVHHTQNFHQQPFPRESRNIREQETSNNRRSSHFTTAVGVNRAPDRCSICSEDHDARECQAGKSEEEIKTIIREKRLCFRCLKPGHSGRNCSVPRSRCMVCSATHPTVLHGIRIFPRSEANQSVTVGVATVHEISENITIEEGARTWIADYQGDAPKSIVRERPAFMIRANGRICSVWLDSCAPQTLICKSLVASDQTFKAQPIYLSGLVGNQTAKSETKVPIVMQNEKISTLIEAYVMDELPPGCDILIGTDMLKKVTQGKPDQLNWKTIFGDVFYGASEVAAEISEAEEKEETEDDSVLNLEEVRKENEFMERVRSVVESNDNSGYVIPHITNLRPEAVLSKLRIDFNASLGKEVSCLFIGLLMSFLQIAAFILLAVFILIVAFIQIADAAARALQSCFVEVGIPKLFVSDNATNFLPLKKSLERNKCMRVYHNKCKSLLDAQHRLRHAEFMVNSRPPSFGAEPVQTTFPDIPRLHKHYNDVRKQFIKMFKNQLFFSPPNKSETVQIGDFVILPDKSSKEGWNVGQIEELHESRDGISRAAKVRTNGTSLIRPIHGMVRIAAGSVKKPDVAEQIDTSIVRRKTRGNA